MKKTLALLLMVAAMVARADTNEPAIGQPLFDREVSVSLGSSYVPNTPYDANLTVGIDAFVTKNLGASLELPFYDPSGVSIDHFNAGIKYRVPIGIFAPYAGGGIGYHWRTEDFDGYLQMGVEARVRKWYGIFLEGRYVYDDVSSWQGFSSGHWGLFGGVKAVLF